MASAPRTLPRWERYRNLVVVAVLALGFALTLAIFVEGNYAGPRCAAHGRQRALTYVALEYPSAPIGFPGRRTTTCLFVTADRQLVTRAFADIAPSQATAVAVDMATTPLMTTPVLFAFFAFVLYQLYGAMGLK
jgi:hypothetical protein